MPAAAVELMINRGRAVCTFLPMELTAETKLSSQQHYSPTSTPVLDVFRPLPPQAKDGLSAGEYFLFSSLVILALVGMPSLRFVIADASANPGSKVFWAVLLAPVAAGLAAIATHEIGHLLAAYFAGFKITSMNLGPLHLGGRTNCGEPYCGDVLTLGVAALQPRVIDQDDTSLRRRLSMIVVNVCF